MIFSTNANTLSAWMQELSKAWQVPITEDCQRLSLNIPDHLGQGVVVVYIVNESIEVIIVRGEFYRDWSVNLTLKDQAPLFLFTLAEGLLDIKIADSKAADLSFTPLQSAIYGPSVGTSFSWNFPADQPILFSSIILYKEKLFHAIDCETLEVPQELVEVLYGIDRQPEFIFMDIFHVPIVSALQEIITQEDTGLLNSTFATAKIYEMLFLQLQQYQLYVKEGQKSNGQVVPRNIAQIRSAESLLLTQLQDPPTIPELAKMVGLNQQHLKKGFKELYGSTINQYLNRERLKRAATLIQAGQLSIQDIAQEVGYNSASYFSRRFKKAYGVSPKYYARRLEQTAQTVNDDQFPVKNAQKDKAPCAEASKA